MKPRFKIAVLLSGRGSNFESLASAVRASSVNAEVALVVSDRESAEGLSKAESLGISTLVVPRNLKQQSIEVFNEKIAAAVRPYQPDLIVLAGFMRVLTSEFIRHFEKKIINIHPSLLPAFPGLHAQQQALDAGVPESGCTVHFAYEEVDAGPIIAQANVPVKRTDTVEVLSERILQQEHELLPAVVLAIAGGNVVVQSKNGHDMVKVTDQSLLKRFVVPGHIG